MDKKEQFKEFVRQNPRLIKFVKEGKMNWQKFYEIYDLYGDDEEAWKEYKQEEKPKQEVKETSTDIMSWLKGFDLDSLQNGMNSLQRVVGLLGELANKGESPKVDEYRPRPLYKHFED